MTHVVLVTGAGGPAGVAVIRSLQRRDDLVVLAADMDPWASGLYLVREDRRRIVPAGVSSGFVDAVRDLVREDAVDVIVSTVDAELLPLAEQRSSLGAVLAAASDEALATCLDKWLLVEACAPHARVPHTMLLDAEAVAHDWAYPVIVKPRRGAGSLGVRLVESAAELARLGQDEGRIVQEHLPGDEHSVDVLLDAEGSVVAAVPRLRARVDSGVAIAGRTVDDPALIATASACARAAGLTGIANVQLRADADGEPALLEINPRCSGSMPLTIAAGVDMPSLAVDLALSIPVPAHVPFRELAGVRFLEDVFVPVESIVWAP